MPNRTITSIIAFTIITILLIITNAPEYLIWACLGTIATLGGVSIWRNNHPKR